MMLLRNSTVYSCIDVDCGGYTVPVILVILVIFIIITVTISSFVL